MESIIQWASSRLQNDSHSTPSRFPADFQPGDDLLEVAHALQLTDERPDWLVQHLETEPDALESGFWRDGTMRTAGRDYTALLETDCHTRGELACTTCHQMHGADPNDQLKAAKATEKEEKDKSDAYE